MHACFCEDGAMRQIWNGSHQRQHRCHVAQAAMENGGDDHGFDGPRRISTRLELAVLLRFPQPGIQHSLPVGVSGQGTRQIAAKWVLRTRRQKRNARQLQLQAFAQPPECSGLSQDTQIVQYDARVFDFLDQ
jgi:hypothetical protein